MKVFDVYLAPKKGTPGPVVATVTDEEAAGVLTEALKSVQGSLFQCEGLRPWYREAERGRPAPEAVPETATTESPAPETAPRREAKPAAPETSPKAEAKAAGKD